MKILKSYGFDKPNALEHHEPGYRRHFNECTDEPVSVHRLMWINGDGFFDRCFTGVDSSGSTTMAVVTEVEDTEIDSIKLRLRNRVLASFSDNQVGDAALDIFDSLLRTLNQEEDFPIGTVLTVQKQANTYKLFEEDWAGDC